MLTVRYARQMLYLPYRVVKTVVAVRIKLEAHASVPAQSHTGCRRGPIVCLTQQHVHGPTRLINLTQCICAARVKGDGDIWRHTGLRDFLPAVRTGQHGAATM